MINQKIRKAVEEALREMIEGKREWISLSQIAVEFNEKFHTDVLKKFNIFPWKKSLIQRMEIEKALQKKENEKVAKEEVVMVDQVFPERLKERLPVEEDQTKPIERDIKPKMQLEYYEDHKFKWVKLDVLGVLASRVKVVKAMFLGVLGEPECGWCKTRFQGIEHPVEVSEDWMKSTSPPPLEGEIFELLLDQINNTAWKIERPTEDYSVST